jgi:hypothetical protein
MKLIILIKSATDFSQTGFAAFLPNLSQTLISVPSWPKILQNTCNSNPAVEKNCLQRKIGGRTADIVWEKRPKNGRKKFWCVKLVFEGCFCF